MTDTGTSKPAPSESKPKPKPDQPIGGTWDEDSKMKSPYPTPISSPTSAVSPNANAEGDNQRPWWRNPSLAVNWTVLSRFALGFWLLTILVITYDSLPSLSTFLPLRVPPFGGPGRDDHVVKCTQPPSLVPTKHKALWEEAMRKIDSDDFREEVVASLQGAVRIRTESFDNTPPPSTHHPAYAPFPDFRAYLRERFPLVHASSSPSSSSPPSSPDSPPSSSSPPNPTPPNTHLNLTLINHHALLYTWPGTSTSLKPLMLCAHQDVVPVPNDTLPLWRFPPYDGTYDGRKIWGRGASDDKSQLIAILSATELLLSQRVFVPARTLLLAFGFDEEASGFHGASALGVEIERRWGEGGVGMIVDEGAGFYDLFGGGRSVSDSHLREVGDDDDDGRLDDGEEGGGGGVTLAIPGVTEKGNYNVRVEVDGPGGHSSFPPRHTTIGLLAEALVLLENEPFEMKVTEKHPVYALTHCLLPSLPLHLLAPSLIPPFLRPILPYTPIPFLSHHILPPILSSTPSPLLSHTLARLLRYQLFRDLALQLPPVREHELVRSLVPTTQAVDVVRGGVKSNALPERAWGVVNHRVSVVSRLGDVQDRYEKVLKPFAEKHGLNFVAWNRTIHETTSPYTLTVLNATAHGVEPAPLTPTTPRDGPWNLLAGTIKGTYRAHRDRTSRRAALEGRSGAQGYDDDDGEVRKQGRKVSRDVLVAPGMMTGNTDTRYYWKLSKHIFRYNHHFGGTSPDPRRNGVHTVDEWLEADVLVESVRFFVTLILNGDEGGFMD